METPIAGTEGLEGGDVTTVTVEENLREELEVEFQEGGEESDVLWEETPSEESDVAEYHSEHELKDAVNKVICIQNIPRNWIVNVHNMIRFLARIEPGFLPAADQWPKVPTGKCHFYHYSSLS